jgi:RimJ/RimL family protein N-acetyltransferase
VTIETKRLLLRSMTAEDTDDFLRLFSDPLVMASFGARPFDRTQAERWVRRNLEHQEKHGYGLFSVILKEEGRLIGDCGLEHMEVGGQPEVELGYDLLSAHWGRGYATEAASAVRDFAFDRLALPRLISLIRCSNAASCRVAEKIGMVRERETTLGEQPYLIYAISADRAHRSTVRAR